MSATAQLSIPLTVALGGTGATTASNALTNLGVSAKAQTLLADIASPDVVLIREDFIGGTNADGQIGNLGWRFNAIGGAGSNAYQLGEANHPGIYRLTTGATSGYGMMLVLTGSSLVTTYAITLSSVRLVFVFKLAATTTMRFQAGMGNGTTSEPTRWFGIRYDTVAGDTNFMAVAYNNDGTVDQTASLGVAADTAWHTAEMESVSATSIRVRIDGGSWQTISSEVPGQFEYLGPYVFMATATSAARSVDLDFIAMAATVSR